MTKQSKSQQRPGANKQNTQPASITFTAKKELLISSVSSVKSAPSPKLLQSPLTNKSMN